MCEVQVEVKADGLPLEKLSIGGVKGTLRNVDMSANLRTRAASATLDLIKPHLQVSISPSPLRTSMSLFCDLFCLAVSQGQPSACCRADALSAPRTRACNTAADAFGRAAVLI